MMCASEMLIGIFLNSVSQFSGCVAVCGAGGMIHAISCLVNTPGTRLTLNSLMPTCPFYQPTPCHPVSFRLTADYFSSRASSLCLRVSAGSLPSPVTSAEPRYWFSDVYASRGPYFGQSEERGNYAPPPLPPRVKPAVSRQNQHLGSQRGET